MWSCAPMYSRFFLTDPHHSLLGLLRVSIPNCLYGHSGTKQTHKDKFWVLQLEWKKAIKITEWLFYVCMSSILPLNCHTPDTSLTDKNIWFLPRSTAKKGTCGWNAALKLGRFYIRYWKKFLHRKDCQLLEQAAQRSGGVTTPGSLKKYVGIASEGVV